MKVKSQILLNVFICCILIFTFTEILYAYEMIPGTFPNIWKNAGLLKDYVIYAVNFHDVTQPPYNAIKNDQGDDYLAIKAAIDAAKGTPGPDIIYFPAGTYYIGSTIDLTRNANSTIDYSGIIFQGDGPYSIIILTMNKRNHGFNICGSDSGLTQNIQHFCIDNIIQSATTFTNINRGDWIYLCEETYPDGWYPKDRGYVGQVNQVSDVIIPDQKYYTRYLPSKCYSPVYTLWIQEIKPIMNIGFEDLNIQRDGGGFDPDYNATNFYFDKAVNCWLRGVESYNTCFTHVRINKSANIEMSGCYIHQAESYGEVEFGDWTNGTGYGLTMGYGATNCLIENNIFDRLRHAILLGEGANCNVISFNYSRDRKGSWLEELGTKPQDLCLHGRCPYVNLFEENYVEWIKADGTHGKNGSYNTFFRNKVYDTNKITIDIETFLCYILGCQLNEVDADFPSHTDIYGKLNGVNVPHSTSHKSNCRLSDISYYYPSKPYFLTGSYTWPSMGCQVTSSSLTQSIISKERYNSGTRTYISSTKKTPTPQVVSGTLSGTTNWSGCKKVVGDVIIPSGAVLNIAPGTVILFNGNYMITINDGGKIVASGTEYYPISFTLSSSVGGEWKYVQVKSSGNVFNYCIFEKAMSPLYLYFANEADQPINTIQNCTFRNNRLYGLRLYNSRALVRGCEMTGNGYYGIYGYSNPDVRLVGNNIHHNQQDGIYSYTNGYSRLYGSLIQYNNANGIYTKSGDRFYVGSSYYQGKNTINSNNTNEIFLGSGSPIVDIYFSSVHDDGDIDDYEFYNTTGNTYYPTSFQTYFGADLTCDKYGYLQIISPLTAVPAWEGQIDKENNPLSKLSSLSETNINDDIIEKVKKYKEIIKNQPKSKDAEIALDSLYTLIRIDYVDNVLNERVDFNDYLFNLKRNYTSIDLGKKALWYLILWEILENDNENVINLSKEGLKVFNKEYQNLIMENLLMTYVHSGRLADAQKGLNEYNKSSLADKTFNELINEDISDIRSAIAKGTFQPEGEQSDITKIPDVFSLGQNYPNPGNPTTTIQYNLAHPCHVTLCVYNILGQEVARLVDRHEEAGAYTVTWDGINNMGNFVSSGVYIYTLSVGGEIFTKKLMFMK